MLKDIYNSVINSIPPIHKEGNKFITIFAVVTIIFFFLWEPMGVIGLALTLWCIYFFRDPERIIPQAAELILSPADGQVCKIEKVIPPLELGLSDNSERYRVSVFLSVFNVHVNRSPVSGKIVQMNYRPGKFFSANLDKCSEENECQYIVIETEDGHQVIVSLIAGLIARRIVCTLKEGDIVKKGERIGIIRFGSRADIYLPSGVTPEVLIGQTMIGGETVIARDKTSRKAVKATKE